MKTQQKVQKISQLIKQVNPRKLTNNTQRALLQLLQAEGEWVARTAVRVPSAAARIRDLRKVAYGEFKVECASAQQLNKKVKTEKTNKPTFYRLNPTSVSVSKIKEIFSESLTA